MRSNGESMNAIDIIGINKNKRKYPEFENASVIKAVKGGETRIDFKYHTVTGSKYTLTASGLFGLETPVPTKTIRTSRLDIPFVQGDSVVIDGELWTVTDLEKFYDSLSAQMLGGADKGWLIYLNGGKGSDK